LTDEEIKINLLLTNLLENIKVRLASFDSKKDSLGSKLSQHEIRKTFIVPLVHTFEDKIFALSKSTFV
jgi:hypothetical protein